MFWKAENVSSQIYYIFDLKNNYNTLTIGSRKILGQSEFFNMFRFYQYDYVYRSICYEVELFIFRLVIYLFTFWDFFGFDLKLSSLSNDLI